MFCARKIELNKHVTHPPTTLIARETLTEWAQAGHLLERAEAQAQALVREAEARCQHLEERASLAFWQRANAQLLRWELERQGMSDSLERIATSITQMAVRSLLDEAVPAQRLTALLRKLLNSQVPTVKASLVCNPQDRSAVERWLDQHSDVPWTLRCEDEVAAQALVLETDEGGFHIDWHSALDTLLPPQTP